MTFYSVGFLIVLSHIIVSLALSYILKIKWEEKPYTAFFYIIWEQNQEIYHHSYSTEPLVKDRRQRRSSPLVFQRYWVFGDFIVIGNNLNRDRDTGVQCKVDPVLL